MAENTPQTDALTKWLLESDDNIAAFKSNPGPHLEHHGVQISDGEHENLKNHLAASDVPAIKMTVQESGAAIMFSKIR